MSESTTETAGRAPKREPREKPARKSSEQIMAELKLENGAKASVTGFGNIQIDR